MNDFNRPLPSPPAAPPTSPRRAPALIGDDFDGTVDLVDQPLPVSATARSKGEGLLSLRFVLPRAA